jgi:hypothetical protein
MPRRPVVGAAATLRERLRAPPTDSHDQPWGDAAAMTRALNEVRKRHDHPAGESVSADRTAPAIADFRRHGRVASFVQLKYVCLGAATGEDCLLADSELLERLLGMVEHVPGRRRKLKGFQCLLRAYWSFPLHGDHVSVAARAGFRRLRDWLARRREDLIAEGGSRAHWFGLLGDHANLLEAQACERYAADLLRGNGSVLQAALDGLAIPGDAWVKEEALLAQARAASQVTDAEWITVLPQLLDIAAGRTGIAVSPALARRYVAVLLARHARCASVAYREDLLDAALSAIGNPWQRRAAWDAYVVDPIGRPCELAREMTVGWLKQGLIEGFFRLHGGTAGRAAHWLRYDPFITSLWVGLSAGPEPRAGPEWRRFLSLAADCLLWVDKLADGEGMLLVRVGNVLAVEFGGASRPLYFYRWRDLAPSLVKQLGTLSKSGAMNLATLAQSRREGELDHRPGETEASWERRFDEYLRSLVWHGV